MRVNILICGNRECLNVIDLNYVKSYFEHIGHEVIISDNFCDEIKNGEGFVSPFSVPEKPVVFAGCSPLVMEASIKYVFKVPLEIANIREQCAWLYSDISTAQSVCVDIIFSAVLRSKFARKFTTPQNILKQKISEYVSKIEEMGSNPFKI